jgi:hypothetical protein
MTFNDEAAPARPPIGSTTAKSITTHTIGPGSVSKIQPLRLHIMLGRVWLNGQVLHSSR